LLTKSDPTRVAQPNIIHNISVSPMVVYTHKVVYSAQKLATSNIVSHFFMSNTRLKFV